MTVNEAINHAYKLQTEWVGKAPEGRSWDLARVHASMLQESRWNRENPARCSPACARETKGKLILLGKIRKALGE